VDVRADDGLAGLAVEHDGREAPRASEVLAWTRLKALVCGSERGIGRVGLVSSPRAELYGLPSLARTNLSSLLNEKRRTASMRSSSSWESPILMSISNVPGQSWPGGGRKVRPGQT
jgi:hypothetical protein